MSNVLRSELLKLRTTRTALGFAVIGVLLVLLVVLVSTLAGTPDTIADKRSVLSIGDPLAVVLLQEPDSTAPPLPPSPFKKPSR